MAQGGEVTKSNPEGWTTNSLPIFEQEPSFLLYVNGKNYPVHREVRVFVEELMASNHRMQVAINQVNNTLSRVEF